MKIEQSQVWESRKKPNPPIFRAYSTPTQHSSTLCLLWMTTQPADDRSLPTLVDEMRECRLILFVACCLSVPSYSDIGTPALLSGLMEAPLKVAGSTTWRLVLLARLQTRILLTQTQTARIVFLSQTYTMRLLRKISSYAQISLSLAAHV